VVDAAIAALLKDTGTGRRELLIVDEPTVRNGAVTGWTAVALLLVAMEDGNTGDALVTEAPRGASAIDGWTLSIPKL